MKTNFYILIIFFLAFLFSNAQSITETVKVAITNTVCGSNDDKQITVETTTTTNENEVMLINASEVKGSIACSNSDIELYFYRLRNVDNLNLMVPKINKAVKA